MTVIGMDEKAALHVKDVCKGGEETQRCRYLIMGKDGWECMKTDPDDKKLVDDFFGESTHKYHGDNCGGYNIPALEQVIKEPTEKKIKSAEERMAEMYKQKAKQASKAYEDALYKVPTPPTDAEKEERRKAARNLRWR